MFINFVFIFHQLLKNIQLLMDASVALMNQYALISDQFPPLQAANATPSTSTNSTAAANVANAADQPDVEIVESATTSKSCEAQKSDNEEEKTVPTANITDDGAGPSTSQKCSSAVETLEIDGNIVTIEDIGRNDPADPNDPVCEMRRKRFERFEAKNQES